jgi:hypothetical protein
MDRPHLEAHWERSPRVLPPTWNQYSREMQSRLLLEGSFFPGGNRDLDYFFYEYRAHWVAEFVRLAFEEVKAVKPRVEISAAVFKNPVQSGRFIGQDWRRFPAWVQYLMPMDYRGHYAGDFDTHLVLLAESIQQQKVWARDFSHLWIGIAATQLYEEERAPLAKVRALASGSGATAEALGDARAAFGTVAGRLKTFAPDLHAAIDAYLKTPANPGDVAAKIDAFLANPPEGYFPPEKLVRTLETVKAQGVEGIVIFSSAGLASHRLWGVAGEFFGRE